MEATQTLSWLSAGTLFTGVALYLTYPTEKTCAVSQAVVQATPQGEQQAAFAAAGGLH